MYLSDRKRRMYLTSGIPQNLVPQKPLSSKDRRFLQKTLGNKKENLNIIISKQQISLYKKHILPIDCGSKIKGLDRGLPPGLFFFAQICLSNPLSLSSFEGLHLSARVSLQVWHFLYYKTFKIKISDPLVEPFPAVQPQTSLFLLSPNNFFGDKRLKSTFQEIYNNYNLCIFIQTIKTHKSLFLNKKLFFRTSSLNGTNQTLKKERNEGLYKKVKTQKCYCRYLYHGDSLKTCTVSRGLPVPKRVSRAKTLLHEKKKIALLYGGLRIKEIKKLSKVATSLPGLFEDNMFTLLESRVDVLIYRAGLSASIAAARQLLRTGLLYLNGKKISSCKTLAKPGDFFSLNKTPQGWRSVSFRQTFGGGLKNQGSTFSKNKNFNLSTVTTKEGEKTSGDKVCSIKRSNTPLEVLLNRYIYTTTILYNKYKNVNGERAAKTPTKIQILNFRAKKEIEKTLKAKNKILNERVQPKIKYCGSSSRQTLTNPKKSFSDNFWPCYSFLWESFFFYYFFFKKKKKQSFLDLIPRPVGLVPRTRCTQESHSFSWSKTASYLGLSPFAFLSFQSKCTKTNFRQKVEGKKVKTNGEHNTKISGEELQKDKKNLWRGPVERGSFWYNERTTYLQDQEQLPLVSKNKGLSKYLKNYTPILINRLCLGHLKKNNLKRKICRDKINILESFFSKNIECNMLPVWGQKPLHLEISYNTGAFIYLYRPQKIINPVYLDWNAVKF